MTRKAKSTLFLQSALRAETFVVTALSKPEKKSNHLFKCTLIGTGALAAVALV